MGFVSMMCVALPVLGSLVLALLLGLGKDVVVRLVLLLDLGKDVVIRLVSLLDLGEDVEGLGEDMVMHQDLVGLVSACYPLVASDVWVGLAFHCHSPFLNPCLSCCHHCHCHRSVRPLRSSLLVALV
jgi:hypothetical protein